MITKVNSKLVATGALLAVLLAGCGGGDSGLGTESNNNSVVNPVVNPVASFSENATRMVSLILDIFARGENSEPIDINSLMLTEADSDEAVPI